MTVEELIARLSELPGHYNVKSPCPVSADWCRPNTLIEVSRDDACVVLRFDEGRHGEGCPLK